MVTSQMVRTVLCAFLGAANVSHPSGQAPSGEVRGLVRTAEVPGRPVRQAIVTLTSTDGIGTASWWEQRIGDAPVALTNDDGEFSFRGVPAGRYRVTAAKPAFLTTEFGASRPGDVGTAVAVTAGGQVVDVSIRLVRGAVITGTLRQPDGRPAANVTVLVTTAGSQAPRASATTDDRGRYRIFGLPAGEYWVSSWLVSTFSPGERSTSVSVADVDAALTALQRRYGMGQPIVTPNALQRQQDTAADKGESPLRPIQVAPTFYPGTVDETSATRLRLAAGESRDNVDFQLMIAGTVEVTGVVHLPDGRPVSGAIVSVALGRTATSGPNGAFRVAGVSPGHHQISARGSEAPSTPAADVSLSATAARGGSRLESALWALEDIEVPFSGLHNLTLALRPAMRMSGRIVFERISLAPPKDFTQIKIGLVSTEMTRLAEIRPDASFDILGVLPGRAIITGTISGAQAPGWWLRSAMLDGRDLLDFPLEFGILRSDARGVVLTFSDRHTEIGGRLELPGGLPGTAYVVALLPSDRRLWQPQGRRLTFMRPATDGRYSFRDIPPGDYVIVALTDIDPVTWQTPEFLESLLAVGVQVAVGEGQRIVQDLRIVR